MLIRFWKNLDYRNQIKWRVFHIENPDNRSLNFRRILILINFCEMVLHTLFGQQDIKNYALK